ncbi:hypothetical protein BKA82DRAFT_148417 [Pisolithus tinctorius]|uniref:Uncharacterized protein n=1 Tax=Pisolithus tinctorius Marx 270 TaxID=870435 RepID=A0A0C3NMD1_PISTI|nr:hypothetical protein BKA82DRAFT_148417 [Pisolithus tinctorius]KIO02065.1 hypothetical protein M404DRAFT_148417 [Pisolithus tinctorius Marx 270]
MEQHLNFYHLEYAHPGKFSGLPLLCEVAAATLLDSCEEEKLSVPQRPAFTNIVEKNTEGMSTGEKHGSANANSFAAGAGGGKCTCHSK